jgi:hypothetical protein
MPPIKLWWPVSISENLKCGGKVDVKISEIPEQQLKYKIIRQIMKSFSEIVNPFLHHAFTSQSFHT